MKPPMPYYGGKIKLGPIIASLLPEHTHYVEPYCGSLAVLLAKAPSAHETVNDLDGSLMTFWRVLRDRRDDLERVCALTPHSRAEHAASFELVDDDLEVARRVWVQLTQGRAGIRKATGWRHYQDGSVSASSMSDYLDGYVKRIAPAAARLRAVSLECRPAVDIITRYGKDPTTLLYVDPPYLGETRSGSSWNGYHHEMRGESDHRALAEALHGCAAAVMLSGYPSELYDLELYPGWHRHAISTATGQGGEWSHRTEVLWSNRPIGAQGVLDLGDAS